MSASPLANLQRWQIEAGGASLIIVIALLGVVLIIQPTIRASAASEIVQDEIVTQQIIITQMNDVHSHLKNQLSSVKASLKESWVQLQPLKYLNARMAQIVDVASDNNLVIDESWSSEAENGPDFRAVVIKLSGSGEYPDSAAFLRAINKELHDVSVVSFNLSGNPDSESAQSRFQFEFVWYAAPISNSIAK